MQVKRFFAADMRQAMKLVRDELGAEAAIIGNRRIAGGVELTAALDYKLSALAPRVPNVELEDELRKTQSRIVTAQAELSSRVEGEEGNRQLFAGLPLTASEPLVEPQVEAPLRPQAAAPAPVDQRLFDSMRSELSGLRVQLQGFSGLSKQRKPHHHELLPASARCHRPAVLEGPGRTPPGHAELQHARSIQGRPDALR